MELLKLTRKEITFRQKNILRMLESHREWITAKQIGRELNFSDKTIQKDINSLIDLLPKDWEIKKVRGKGYRLNKPLNEGVCLFSGTPPEDQLEFEIIKKLLSEKAYTIQTLSDCLYVNRRSLQEKLLELDKKLKTYQLSIKRRPLRLVGSESAIRVYWHDLVSKKINDYHIVKQYGSHFQKNYSPIIRKIEKAYNVRFSRMSILRLLCFFNNTLFRIQQGHNIGVHHTYRDKVIHSKEYESILPIFRLIERDFQVSLNIDERVFLFILAIHIDFESLHAVGKPNVILSYIKRNREKLSKLIHLMEILENHTKGSLRSNARFIQSFYNFYQNINLRFRYMDQSYFKSLTILHSQNIKSRFKRTYQQVRAACNEWSRHNRLPLLINHDIARLTMLVETANLNVKFQKKHVLLIESDWLSITNYTYSLLKKVFKHQLDITVKPINQITDEQLNTLQIDFIISPIPLHGLCVPIILVDTILSEHDLTKIERMLYK